MEIIKNLYDLISILVLYVFFYSIFERDYIMFFGIITSNIIHKIIKFSTTGLNNRIFDRPKKNFNNNLFNQGGYSNRSGFPSGHMTTISFFTNTLLFRNNDYSVFAIVIFNIPCLFMALARYYRHSHNVIQIIAGYILGLFCALYFYTYQSYIDNFINKFYKQYIYA